MPNFDVRKMKNTHVGSAIFLLKKKVRQDKLLSTIGYLVFNNISEYEDYSKGIVKVAVTITNGIDIFYSLDVTLKIKEVYSNGIVNIPDITGEAVRVEEMIKKHIDDAYDTKDQDYMKHLPYISTDHYPGTSKLQDNIVLFNKDNRKWNTKAMVLHLLKRCIPGLLYVNHNMIVSDITRSRVDWAGEHNRTFQADLIIDYEQKKCRVELSIPFDYLDRNTGIFCSTIRLEEIVANVAEQLRGQVSPRVTEDVNESEPTEKEITMEEKVSESVLRTLTNEYCAEVLSKLVEGTTKEKLDILELEVIRRITPSENDGASVSIHFTIERDDSDEVLDTVSHYLDSYDVYWGDGHFKIMDHDNKVNTAVEDLREKINTIYKEKYQSDFETIASLTIDRTGESIEGMEFQDILDLLRHSLMLNAQHTLSDLEKKHGITGQHGVIHLADLLIESEVDVHVSRSSTDMFSCYVVDRLELIVSYRLLNSQSKPVLMATYRNNYGVVYLDGACKLNQEQINSDLDIFIHDIKNEILVNLD